MTAEGQSGRKRGAENGGRRLAIVTGGSSGIGLACARVLAQRGHRVALLARDAAKLDRARRSFEEAGHEVLTVSVDVTDATACRTALYGLVQTFGAPDWVIASAGTVHPGSFLDQDVALHGEQLEANYLGTLYIVHAIAPVMVERGTGSLVLISSGAGLIGVLGYAGYSASKFAVRGLAEVLRVELAASGVNVTVAFPPDTDTPQLAYEIPRRPPATSIFLRGADVWSAEAVARHIVATADAGRFVSAPGWRLQLLCRLGGLVAPFIRAKQRQAIRHHGMSTSSKTSAIDPD